MKEAGKFEASSSRIVFEDSDEDLSCSSVSSSDEEEEETEKELTFEEIHKLRADGSKPVPRKPNQVKKTGRANKNRPVELSSKKPVSRYREVIHVPKKEPRDPRFVSLGGRLDLDGFKKRYNFFFEDKLPVEREELKKQLKKTKNQEEANKLKNELTYVEKMLKYEPSTKNKGAAILTEHKKREREAAKEGKKPYYLKKSEIRKQTLVEKYNSLKESGKLSSYLDKRRKKNATKDHRYIPYRRSEE
ncbi:PREDICTED: rRNA biogenesis protein rrp36 [Camelina sativa]|uniref:rRNA biogenesis protein RRP36 n=1 Tax=Camelina sativa TaxID=90675 RepID=A0ABM0Y2H9_CAMSA|nr:PREDICTED: rRNA biogenesis protein rrp36 [Camelina sativa]